MPRLRLPLETSRPLLHQLGVTENAGERIIEFMRYSGNHLTQGRQPFAMKQARLDLPPVGDISMDFQPSDGLLITIEHGTRVAFHDLLLRFCHLQLIPEGLATAKLLPPSCCDVIAMRQLAGHSFHDLPEITQFPQTSRFYSQFFSEPVIHRPDIHSKPEQKATALQRCEQGRQHSLG